MTLMELYKRRANNDLLAFTLFTKSDYEVNWHHKVLADKLSKVASGEIQRLMIFMPPQHGKSELASRRFPAFLLGRNPNMKILACTHTADFAQSINRDVQRIIDHDAYRAIFKDVYLASKHVKSSAFGNYIRTSTRFEIVNKSGGYRCSGVEGGISGNPADLLILDDPYKSFEDAQSPTIREKVWRFWNGDFLSRRRNDKVPIVLIQTRWHEDDLAGRLIRSESDKWEIVKFPALKSEEDIEFDNRVFGQGLWNEKFSDEEYADIRTRTGSYMFSALYQQNPTPLEGETFKRKDFRFCEYDGTCFKLHNENNEEVATFDRLASCNVFQTVDLNITASAKSDYTVICTWAVSPNNDLILFDMFRKQVDGADHIALIETECRKHQVNEIIIESVQYQTTLIQQALRKGLPAKGYRADTSKIVRSLPAMALNEGHKLYIWQDMPGVDNVISELLSFPNGKNDDIVDCLSMASIRLGELNSIPIADLPKYNAIKAFKRKEYSEFKI